MEDEFRDFRRRRHRDPGYLPDAERRLGKPCSDWAEQRGTPVWVRLVKGAYWDYETVIAQAHGWPIPVFPAEMGDRTPTSSG